VPWLQRVHLLKKPAPPRQAPRRSQGLSPLRGHQLPEPAARRGEILATPAARRRASPAACRNRPTARGPERLPRSDDR